MKLKYYLNNKIILMILFSLIFSCLIIQNVSGYTLTGSSNPRQIFKCQPSYIYANLTGTDVGSVTDVDVWMNNTQAYMINGSLVTSNVKYDMTNYSNNWLYIYGNNPALVWGNKSVSFYVYKDASAYYNGSIANLLVYSDSCVGSNITNFSQVPTGLGNYTSRLWTTNYNLLEFAMYPWVEYWGYVVYLIIIFVSCVLIYMKSQRIIEPLLVGFICLGVLASTTWVPDDFKQYIVMILGVSVGAILYKIFKS